MDGRCSRYQTVGVALRRRTSVDGRVLCIIYDKTVWRVWRVMLDDVQLEERAKGLRDSNFPFAYFTQKLLQANAWRTFATAYHKIEKLYSSNELSYRRVWKACVTTSCIFSTKILVVSVTSVFNLRYSGLLKLAKEVNKWNLQCRSLQSQKLIVMMLYTSSYNYNARCSSKMQWIMIKKCTKMEKSSLQKKGFYYLFKLLKTLVFTRNSSKFSICLWNNW